MTRSYNLSQFAAVARNQRLIQTVVSVVEPMANSLRKPQSVDTNAEALLRETLAECQRSSDRLRDLLRLADALIAVLPADRRVTYLELVERFRAIPRPARGDPINDNIIEFVKGKQEVTTAEIRASLIGKGIPADQKKVANSIDYLVRRNQLQRIGPGRFRDPETGAGFVGDPDGNGRGYE